MNGLNNGIYEPLSADGKPNLGKNLSLIVFDETLGQPNEEMWSAMETSQGLRDEPLFVSASTAGNSRSSFYYIIYELMKDIQADPASAPDTLVSIFEVPEEMDWKLPEAFMLANPAAGEGGFRDPEEIKKMLAKAVKSEGTAAFRQFYLNQWAQYGQRTLVSLNKWDLCKVLDLDLTPEMKECRVVGGLDLSSTTDLTGVGIIIEPLGGTKIWIIFTFAWLAGEDLSECSKRDHLPYEKWEEGDIIFFDGKPTIQIEAVLDILIKLKTHFPKFEKLGYDPYLIAKEPMGENETKAYNSKQESLLKLIEPYFELIPVPQQYAFLSPAVKRLKTKILDKEIQHDGNPLLRSCIENARVLEDASGNIRLDKSKSTSRIDPLIALIIAGTIALKEGFR
jgi:phage terminase large subunit-like protein